LTVHNIELDLIAFLQRLVPIQLNCGIVNEHIRTVFTADESVTFGVVKPLDLPFVLSHRLQPSFTCDVPVLVGNPAPILLKTRKIAERFFIFRNTF